MSKILTTSRNPDVNYLAQVVELQEVTKHPNADKLQLTTVSGSEVITGLVAKSGDIYIYFPVECQIEHKFLCWSNSYSDKERNRDINKKGFFNKQGRVRMTKLRDIYSNGYIIPATELEKYIKEFYGETINIDQSFVGLSFDSIKSDRFVKKFVRFSNTPSVPRQKSKGNIKKYESKLVENQFAFHQDTLNLRKEIAKINPDDYIAINNKIHGCIKWDTILNVRDRGKMTIKQILEEGVKVSVRAYDLLKERDVWAEISDFHFKPNDGEWYEIELDNGKKITITGNNPVFLPELYCYRRVDELSAGDILQINC